MCESKRLKNMEKNQKNMNITLPFIVTKEEEFL